MKPYKSLRFKGNGSLSMWLVSILVVLLSSCIDQMDEYYEKPGWLKGNIYQILEQDGNYSLFLQGLDRAGFKQMVNGKKYFDGHGSKRFGICFVFADTIRYNSNRIAAP